MRFAIRRSGDRHSETNRGSRYVGSAAFAAAKREAIEKSLSRKAVFLPLSENACHTEAGPRAIRKPVASWNSRSNGRAEERHLPTCSGVRGFCWKAISQFLNAHSVDGLMKLKVEVVNPELIEVAGVVMKLAQEVRLRKNRQP